MGVRDRVAKHRAEMSARGYRAVQVWVPDVRRPEFAVEARRQAELIAAAEEHDDTMEFIEAVSDWDEE